MERTPWQNPWVRAVTTVLTLAVMVMIFCFSMENAEKSDRRSGVLSGSVIRLLCPVAPQICEEINERLGNEGFLALAPWPEYDEKKTVDARVEVAVQINGKLRSVVTLPKDCTREEALAAAHADPKTAPFLEGKTVVKEIVVPNRIVNIVVR